MAVQHVNSGDNLDFHVTNNHSTDDAGTTPPSVEIDNHHHHHQQSLSLDVDSSSLPSVIDGDRDSSDSDLESCPFEGPEKLLEIWFAPSADQVPDALTAPEGKSGLRAVDRKVWEDMLDIVKCKILSVVKGREVDAYLLSESSLFISPHRLILKTCGTTLNLLGLPRILQIAQTHAQMTHIHRAFYSRKSFMFPERQLGPHKEWKSEVSFLEGVFGGGRAYTVGRVNGDYWLLYLVECAGGCEGSVGTPSGSVVGSNVSVIGGLGGEWTYVPSSSSTSHSPAPSLSGFVTSTTTLTSNVAGQQTSSLANSFYSSTSSASSTSALSSSALASSTISTASTSITSTSDETPLKPWGGRSPTIVGPLNGVVSGSGGFYTQLQSLTSSYTSVYPSSSTGGNFGSMMGLPLSPPTEEDYTIEILMTHLSARARAAFFTPKLNHGEADDDNGYENQKENEADTDTPSSYALKLSNRLGISDLFPREVTRLDAYAFTPCGYSSNALLTWGKPQPPDTVGQESESSAGEGGADRKEPAQITDIDPNADIEEPKTNTRREVTKEGGEGYYTIHVTPEEGWSYASFECNVPLPTHTPRSTSNCNAKSSTTNTTTAKEIPDLQTLIQRVVRIFEPGRITMTLFISSAGSKEDEEDASDDDVVDVANLVVDDGQAVGGGSDVEEGKVFEEEDGYVDAGGKAKANSNLKAKLNPKPHQVPKQQEPETETAIELAQRVFKSALMKVPVRALDVEEDPNIKATANASPNANPSASTTAKYLQYRRTDKINYEFGGYDLAFASFELKGVAW